MSTSIIGSILRPGSSICYGLLLVLLLASVSILQASPPTPGLGPTLLIHPVSADVERGESSQIILEAIPSMAGDIKFTVSKTPEHGLLSEIRRKSPNAVLIVYTNNGDKDPEDEFTFRVKAPGKSWATAKAHLSIKNPPNSLQVVPSVLDFGKVGLGDSRTNKVVLKNRLADSVAGTLVLPTPWHIQGDGQYNLNYGESAEFSVLYAPHEVTRSMAIIHMLPSGNGPKLTLQGESMIPFVMNTNAVSISAPDHPAEISIQSQLDHEMTIKVVTDELIAVIPPISLKPRAVRRLNLRAQQPSPKQMQTTVRLTYGEYSTDMAVTILPSSQSTNQPTLAHDSIKTSHADGLSTIEKTPNTLVTQSLPPSSPPNQQPTQIGAGLSHVSTGPVLLPEEEQAKLRPLLASNICYFLKPGLFGWHLTLQWHCDAVAPKEFLIEQRCVVPTEQGGSKIEYRRVKPRWIKAQGNGIWSADIPPPSKGFQFLRIAPILEGDNQTVWATFQIQMPANSLIWNRYRIPAALALIVVLVVLIRRIRSGI